MPDDDIDSYWEGLRPRRESSRPPAERVEIPSPSRVIPFVASPQPVSPPIQQARPPHGLIDRHNPDAGLSTIRSLRQSLQARALDGPPQTPPVATGGDPDPDLGLRRELEWVRTLRESEGVTPERRVGSNTWAEFEPLSVREQRIRNHAFMDGLSTRDEPNGNSTLTRLSSSLAALGITGSVGQERLPNGNRAVTILMLPVTDEVPHFLVGARVTQNGGVEVVVEFPEE